MKKPIRVILVLFFIVAAALCSGNDSLYSAKSKVEAPRANNDFSQGSFISRESGHSSLMAKDGLAQNKSLSFGYYSGNNSSASVLSYTHGFDYAISNSMRTTVTVDISQTSSKGLTKTELTPSLHLDWRPKDGTILRIDLQLAPQKISGDNFLVNPWHRPIGF